MKVQGNSIHLSIQDDGIGFQAHEENNHFGMQFMRERVLLLSGKMNVETGDYGTHIYIEIPRYL